METSAKSGFNVTEIFGAIGNFFPSIYLYSFIYLFLNLFSHYFCFNYSSKTSKIWSNW